MNSNQVIALIKSQAGEITSDIIKGLVKDNIAISDKMKKRYNEYLGKVKILERPEPENTAKINSKLANDYAGDIIDGVVGYLWGVGIDYGFDKADYSETQAKTIDTAMKEFIKMNSMADLDSTTGEYASICGYGARLLYNDTEAKIRATHINPWETIFITNSTTGETEFALIYYSIDLIENGKTRSAIKVEWYDKTNVTYYVEDKAGNYIEMDASEVSTVSNPAPHLFDRVPVIQFKNNNALQSDFEKVIELINAYDRALSDGQNELEQFALAYLMFFGIEVTQETIDSAKRTGALGFPDAKTENSAEYLTKNINDIFFSNMLTTLNNNIYKHSRSVDMTDENFSGGAMSGESRKWKLVPLENKSIKKERKFTKAIQEEFRLISYVWNLKKIPFDYITLTLQYTRSLPVDLEYHASVTEKLDGRVSDKTRLSILPFVEDADAELEAMRKDEELDNDENGFE